MSRRSPYLALIALLVTTACGSGSSPAKSAAPQAVNDGGTFDATHQPRVDVTASNFRFSPSTIDGTAGEKVVLVVHNTSTTEHNVTQKADGVDVDLEGGDTKTVTLTIPAGGRLVFICEYHHARGMAGSVGTTGSTLPTASASPPSDTNPY